MIKRVVDFYPTANHSSKTKLDKCQFEYIWNISLTSAESNILNEITTNIIDESKNDWFELIGCPVEGFFFW